MPAIVYRDDDGGIVAPAREAQFPTWAHNLANREAIDHRRYLETWHTHHGVRSVSLITACAAVRTPAPGAATLSSAKRTGDAASRTLSTRWLAG
ncbi:MAG: hypothetical protein M9927_22255 [Anaerolineae bacterium]|nr:hypothetical protein [Anaerolineae bacterium]